MVYLELERLQPETVTQGVLFKHVKQVSRLCAFQAHQAGQLFGYFKQVSCLCALQARQAGQLFECISSTSSRSVICVNFKQTSPC